MAQAPQDEQVASEFADENERTDATIPVKLNKVQTQDEFVAFRSRMSGLSFLVKADKTDATLNQTVRFVPYAEKYQGDDISVGYLKTNITQVIELAREDPNVDEITDDEYEKATGKNARPIGY